MPRVRTTVIVSEDVLENTKVLAEIEDRSVSRILERSLKLYLSVSSGLPDVEYKIIVDDVLNQMPEE